MRIDTLPEEDQHALGHELAGLDGAELMLERLLGLAGLGEVPFGIEVYENDEALLAGLSGWHRTHGAPRSSRASAMTGRSCSVSTCASSKTPKR